MKFISNKVRNLKVGKLLQITLTLILGLILCSGECTPQDAPTEVTDPGVTINTVTWATRNVAAFGKFAATPESTGMFYQWNRQTAYSATDPLTPAWNAEVPSNTWNSANDPCPAGWRMPTRADFDKLVDAAVTYEWTGTGGRFTHAGKSLFLPAAGHRGTNGLLMNTNVESVFWSNTNLDATTSWFFGCSNAFKGELPSPITAGYSIRCVKGAK